MIKRIVNRKLLNTYQGIECLICGSLETTVGHHIKSKGAGGDDSKYNLVPLCVIHHNEIHKSLMAFSDKYKIMHIFLVNNDWECFLHNKKWLHVRQIRNN